MANFDTVVALTDNLERVLRAEGIKFSRALSGDVKSLAASTVPVGNIEYRGESFQYNHGERAGYVEALFDVSVTIRERDGASRVRNQQDWVHRVRSALTVSALNIGELQSSKLVSNVTVTGIKAEAGEGYSVLNAEVTVRYREL